MYFILASMNNILRMNAPVLILRFRYVGYRGRVIKRDACDRFYTLQVTHDAEGKRLKEPFEHGLYARQELEHR